MTTVPTPKSKHPSSCVRTTRGIFCSCCQGNLGFRNALDRSNPSNTLVNSQKKKNEHQKASAPTNRVKETKGEYVKLGVYKEKRLKPYVGSNEGHCIYQNLKILRVKFAPNYKNSGESAKNKRLDSKGESSTQVMRPKEFMPSDPPLIVEGKVIPDDEHGIHNYWNDALELNKLRIIQDADTNNGQGLILGGNSGLWKKQVLLKRLGHQNEFNCQIIRNYQDMGFPTDPAAIQNHQLAEDTKNKEREIAFAYQLNHPNITKILAFISTTGKPEDITAIVMEGASVGTLETYAQKSQIPYTLLKNLALQLASALEYCHELHIIHRDVRPRNIYVHNEGKTIKLGNFGYAKEEDEKPKTANKGDEVYYKAPEVICAQTLTTYSFPVDVYGWALVAWSMAHEGKKPYKSEGISVTNHSNFRRYLTESNNNRPKITSPDVDEDLAKLVRECWKTQTGMDKRPTMSEVVAELERLTMPEVEL